jgi:hypothetical protein
MKILDLVISIAIVTSLVIEFMASVDMMVKAYVYANRFKTFILLGMMHSVIFCTLVSIYTIFVWD